MTYDSMALWEISVVGGQLGDLGDLFQPRGFYDSMVILSFCDKDPSSLS